MPQHNQPSSEPPSLTFSECFQDDAAASIVCKACGRIHYAKELQDMDADTYSKYEADKKTILHSKLIPVTYLNGMCVVLNCPCGKATEFEGMLWHEFARVVAYLQERTHEVKEIANQRQDSLDVLLRKNGGDESEEDGDE